MKRLTVCLFGTYDKNFSSNKLVIRGLEENNVEVVTINVHTPVTELNSKAHVSIFSLIKRILRKNRIFVEIVKNIDLIKRSDVIYVGYPGHFDVLIAYPVAKIFRKKLVFNPLVVLYTGFTEEQGIISKDSLLGKLFKFGESLIYRSVDLLIADTPFQKNHFIHEFGVNPNKIDVLPIGADDQIYKNLPKTTKSKALNVTYYGLYSPSHGVKYLIEAANKLKREDIIFVMVGKGNTFDRDYARAQKLGLKNMVFHKEMTEADAFETLRNADIFIGFLEQNPVVERVVPNKVYQGLALGKTVLTVKSPAITSVLTDRKNVFLCTPRDVDDIAQSILTLKTNPKLNKAISSAGYELFVKSFNSKSIGKNLSEMLRRLD